MKIKNTLDSFGKKGYSTSFFESKEGATEYLVQNTHGKVVGFGDSATLQAMCLYERLSVGNEVHNPMLATDNDDFLRRAAKALDSQIFITSANATAETGELINIDGTGNRIAGSLFGHEKVYFIIGTNKIEPTLEKAIWRARNIAAPQNAKRLGLKTPCGVHGDKCYNCKSPERICNGMLIYLNKMSDIEMEIILINERLGL